MAIDLPQERVSRWVGASGWILLTGVVVFLGAYIYEQTYLTWLLGPSDLPSAGSLLTMPLFLFGLVTTILSHLWLIAVLGVSFWRKQIPGTITWLAAGLLAITLPLAYLPFNVWDWLAVEILGPGLHAADYLSRAAGTGDERLVRALLSQGVDVNRYDSNGTTALHAAAGGRQEHMVQFLIRHTSRCLGATGLLRGDTADGCGSRRTSCNRQVLACQRCRSQAEKLRRGHGRRFDQRPGCGEHPFPNGGGHTLATPWLPQA